jgi:hypothetical protein
VKPVVQSRTGETGTCFRACLASILELPESTVPDFKDANQDPEVNTFLAKHGLRYQQVPISTPAPIGWHTIEGISPRGGQHAVVGYDGHLVHDPHPRDGTGRGLVEPQWWGLLLPIEHSQVKDFLSLTRKKPSKPDPVVESARQLALSYRDLQHKYPRLEYDPMVWRSIADLEQFVRTHAKDRADMEALRRNTAHQGGPLHVQITEKDGRERTVPTKVLRAYDDLRPVPLYDSVEFKEAAHPRRKDGKFGRGAGGGSSTRGHVDTDYTAKTLPQKESVIRKELGVSAGTAKKYASAVHAYGGPEDYRKIRNGEMPHQARALQAYVDAAPKWDGNGPVYRGLDLSPSEFKVMKAGAELSMGGVNSWSSDVGVSDQYAAKFTIAKRSRVVLEMAKADTGTSIAHLTDYPSEREVLMSGTTRFKVLSVGVKRVKKGGVVKHLHVVKVEEVPA